jgi:diguanylate cyclase (GGDEF)-like protein/hemerythrin-like metal-binding protein
MPTEHTNVTRVRPSHRPGADALASALDLLVRRELLAVGVVRDGLLVQASPRLEAMIGRELGGGVRVDRLVAEADRARVARAVAAVALTPVTLHCDALRADGSVFEAEVVVVRGDLAGGAGTVVLVTDVTDRRRAEKQLSSMAYVDPLTGLANRALFLDRLRDALVAARRDGHAFALVMVDLDGFKAVNDELGHDAGDAVLATVARRLELAVREHDTVARLGGDEFAAIVPRIARREDAVAIAERVLASVRLPIEIGGVACQVGSSLGIATFPDDGSDLDGLIARADRAMYESKRAGKHRYTFATPASGPPSALLVPFFAWTDGHVVGNSLMDAQHRGLFELANRLGAELKAGRDAADLARTLDELTTFAARHFATEEQLMRDAPGFPLEERHVQAHRKLVADVQSLCAEVDAASMSRMMRFIQEWLVRHMEQLDQPLAAYLAARAG